MTPQNPFDAMAEPVCFSLPPPTVEAPTRPDVVIEAAPRDNVVPLHPEQEESLESVPTVRLEIDSGLSLVERFARLVAEVDERDPFYASDLRREVRVVACGPEGVFLAAPEADHRTIHGSLGSLREAVTLAWGPATTLELVACPPGDERLAPETLAERAVRLANEKREARRDAAREDRKVQLAVEVLGAEVVEITPR